MGYVDANSFPKVILGGLTGATAGTRFVGAVASGAPASGTFLLNDLAFDVAGNKFWLCTVAGTPGTWSASGGGSGLFSAYLCYRDQKTAGTAGGTFTSGAWQTRVLNTEQADTGNHGALASNQITLDAGTYRVSAWASAFKVTNHQIRLRNITDSATILSGTGEYCSVAGLVGNKSNLSGLFTIGGAKVLELQHQCLATEASDGFGVAANFGEVEVYSSVELWKE